MEWNFLTLGRYSSVHYLFQTNTVLKSGLPKKGILQNAGNFEQ